MVRRTFLVTLMILGVAGSVDSATPVPLPRIDAALAKAGHFLLEKQSADGAWRSETYGALRDGPSLTPLVLSSLFYMRQTGPAGEASFRKGVDYLVRFVGADGQLTVAPRELIFPVYTSASASRVVVLKDKTPENLRAQQAWLAYLRGRQLTESLGWQLSDPEYGGWGFSFDIPRKPAVGTPREFFVESNLAATVFGIAALTSAKTPTDDPAFVAALAFVKKCQNYSDTAESGDSQFDDGGFFFIPNDAGQNKAGVAGTDQHGRQRFHSYGTMTADGLRSLLRCGLPAEHPRVVAARRWLDANFSATDNPGRFAADREVLRNATYYYWAWAAAHAYMALNDNGKWSTELAEELIRRQRPDGSWANSFTDAKEDDPLVATAWASAALAICRVMNDCRTCF